MAGRHTTSTGVIASVRSNSALVNHRDIDYIRSPYKVFRPSIR
jgi:hypothetical protein